MPSSGNVRGRSQTRVCVSLCVCVCVACASQMFSGTCHLQATCVPVRTCVCVCVRGFAPKCFWCDVPVGNNNSSCPGHTYTIAIVTSYIPIMSCQSLPASCHHFLPSLLCHHVISICHIWACIATCHIAIQNLPRHNCHLCVEPNCVYIVKAACTHDCGRVLRLPVLMRLCFL